MDIDKTLAERGSRYGDFYTHAKITQTLKDIMQHTNNWKDLPDDMKEALDMIAHKVGRILNGDPYFHDSWHDIVGYTKLVADRLADKENHTELLEEANTRFGEGLNQQIQMIWGCPASEITDE